MATIRQSTSSRHDVIVDGVAVPKAEQPTRTESWVCAKCFDALESAGQFAGMCRYPEYSDPLECEQCQTPMGRGYCVYIEL